MTRRRVTLKPGENVFRVMPPEGGYNLIRTTPKLLVYHDGPEGERFEVTRTAAGKYRYTRWEQVEFSTEVAAREYFEKRVGEYYEGTVKPYGK